MNVRSWYDTDGLPQNSVESLSFDVDGRLWVTTRDGGAVFDGTAWTTIPMPEPHVTNWPRELLAASDRSVWFGVEPEGLHRRVDGTWRSWGPASGIPGRVTALLEHEGTVIVGTTRGIHSVHLSSGNPSTERPDGDVAALARQGSVVHAVLTDGTMLRRDGTTWIADPDRRAGGSKPLSLLVTEGRTLVGTVSGIVTFRDGASAETFDLGVPVTSIVETRMPDGASLLWAATEGAGLLVLDDGRWVPPSGSLRLPNRYVYGLLVSPSNGPSTHLVAGTLSGIARIDLAAWRHIGAAEGLPDPSVVSILESRRVFPGTFFLGTTAGLAVLGAEGRWERSSCQALASGGVFAMHEGADRRSLYFGTGNGVVVMDASGCRRLPGLDGVSVVALAETGTDSTTLWAGTYGDGLWSRDDAGTWTPYGGTLPDPRVEALAVSGVDSGNLWIATNAGLARLSGGTLRVFDRGSGLPHDLVRSLLVREGEIWAGTSRGLAHAVISRNAPQWTTVDLLADGRMENATVYRIEVDETGRVYAFTGRGIARLQPDVTGTWQLGRVFLSDDGLPSSETNFGASHVDSRGRIWAGTPLGAGVYDPARESDDRSQAHKLIVTMTSEPDGRIITGGEILAASADRLVASFRLIDLVHGHRAVYRTELTGLDDGPGDWTPTAQRVFSKLPGGRYELRVWGRDPHGHEAGPVTLTFSLQQPLWLSWWAVLVYVAATVVLLYTFVGFRIRTLRRRNMELELLVRSRTRDLEVANRQLESANVTLADMSVTDPLTGAKNRRYLLQKMEQEAVRVRRSTRESDDIVFLLVDIDRFKFINDRFGHATGDHVLKQFHRVLTHAVRDTDTIVRWGGEEFLVVARRISRSEAGILAQRILDMVRGMHFESMDSRRHLRLTCSIGFASFPFVTWDRGLFTWEQVVDIADHCLYAVKRSGRDGWVSLAAGPQLRADSFLSRMRDDVESLTETNEVTVVTSFEDPGKLVWR